MKLDKSAIEKLGQAIVENGVQDRHRGETTQRFKTVYGIEPGLEPDANELDPVFKRVIQSRANPLADDDLRGVVENVSVSDVLTQNSHEEAMQMLLNTDHIGQKIANEFLRQAVDVLEVRRDDWKNELHVLLIRT